MTTPTPERLVQLHSRTRGLLERLDALVLDHEQLLKRRLPATTKLNTQQALHSLREARKSIATAVAAFLGEGL